MKEITTLKEMQSILLDILIHLDKVCRKHNLKYMMVDGTLLGAVRHKGFIPWDDDIDVWMPREDYDKLAQYVNADKSSPYRFQTPQNTKGFTYSYGKLVDTRTIVEEKVDIKMEMGLFIDVFPYDGLPKPGTKKYNKFLSKCMFLQRQRLASLFTWEESKIRRNNSAFGFFAWGVRKAVGCVRISRMIDKNARKYPVSGSEMVGCLGGGYMKNQMMEKEIVENITELEFEGYKLYAPKDYDRYLKKLYGDYMILPPIEKQKIQHMNKAWWK